MKLTIESTSQLTLVDGAWVRVWRGVTEGGVRCAVFVSRIAVDADQDCAAFERELREIPLELQVEWH